MLCPIQLFKFIFDVWSTEYIVLIESVLVYPLFTQISMICFTLLFLVQFYICNIDLSRLTQNIENTSILPLSMLLCLLWPLHYKQLVVVVEKWGGGRGVYSALLSCIRFNYRFYGHFLCDVKFPSVLKSCELTSLYPYNSCQIYMKFDVIGKHVLNLLKNKCQIFF